MSEPTTDAGRQPVPSVRSFVAIPLPDRVRADLLAAVVALQPTLPGVKWSRKAENLHVTVKFLGQVAEERIGELGMALARAAATVPRFDVEVRGMGAFPSARKASVIWVGVEATDTEGRLARVAEAVEGAALELGIGERETRPFRAHVTVGRAKGGVDARAALARFADRSFGKMTIEELHLYESRLGGGSDDAGSTYVLRSRAPLDSN